MSVTDDKCTLEETEYRHTPLNHEKPSFRLVRVLPGHGNDVIQCEIVQQLLPQLYSEDEPGKGVDTSMCLGYDDQASKPFVCLSYTWHTPQDQMKIRINGKILRVRKNLWDFLWIARHKSFGTLLWIDAICIDQNNTAERNHQVQQMGRIYSAAKTVLVWLGNDLEIAQILHFVNEASRELRVYHAETRSAGAHFWKSHALADDRAATSGSSVPGKTPGVSLDTTLSHGVIPGLDFRENYNLLIDSTGKVEKIFEKLAENEYWSRAWVSVLENDI